MLLVILNDYFCIFYEKVKISFQSLIASIYLLLNLTFTVNKCMTLHVISNIQFPVILINRSIILFHKKIFKNFVYIIKSCELCYIFAYNLTNNI